MKKPNFLTPWEENKEPPKREESKKPPKKVGKKPPQQMECWWLNGWSGFIVMILLAISALIFGTRLIDLPGVTTSLSFLYVLMGISIALIVSDERKNYVNIENIAWASGIAIGIPLIITISIAIIGPVWTVIIIGVLIYGVISLFSN